MEKSLTSPSFPSLSQKRPSEHVQGHLVKKQVPPGSLPGVCWACPRSRPAKRGSPQAARSWSLVGSCCGSVTHLPLLSLAIY